MPKKMQTKKAGVGIKRRTSRKTAPKVKRIVSSRTREELLIKRLAETPSKMPNRGLEFQDLLYNSASELRSLAFKSGFNLGAEVYRGSKRSIASLEHVLEHAGMGKVVYNSFGSESAFVSYGVKAHGLNLMTEVHIFEAGIISGYLTSHAKRLITAEEVACVFNGSPYCRFVARAEGETRVAKTLEFSRILSALRTTMLNSESPKKIDGYYMLAIEPILVEPVFSEASKFLYLSGKLLANSGLPAFRHTVRMAANFFGVEGAELISNRKKELMIHVAYGHETSTYRFVKLTTAFFSGLVKGTYGNGVSVSRSLSSKGVYNVRIQILNSGALRA